MDLSIPFENTDKRNIFSNQNWSFNNSIQKNNPSNASFNEKEYSVRMDI